MNKVFITNKRRILFRITAQIMAIVLIIGIFSAVEVDAAEKQDASRYIIYLDESSYIEIRNKQSECISVFYENGLKTQVAACDKTSGVIDYYEIKQQNDISWLKKNSEMELYKTKSYNIDDFYCESIGTTKEYASPFAEKKLSSPSYSLLKSKILEDYSGNYYRYLYGYSYINTYNEGNWAFKAQTPVSIVTTAIVKILDNKGYTVAAKILEKVEVAAGVILSALAAQYVVKDYCWSYKFLQILPKRIEFICSGDFVYESKAQIAVNGNDDDWETTYTKPAYKIEQERNDILLNPGYYM